MPPWDKRNPKEQEIIRVSEEPQPSRINKLLIETRPKVIEIIDPSTLWPHLRSLYVVDSGTIQKIEVSTVKDTSVKVHYKMPVCKMQYSIWWN